jgi:flagellin-like protein
VPRRKGISPVIATVIIVAVTIAVAIAVAFWMTGIVGLFTAAEKLEIVSLYAQPKEGGWTVTITVRNTGTTPTSIDEIFINGVPSTQCGDAQFPQLPIRLNPGEEQTFQIDLNDGGQCGPTTFRAGGSIEVKLHSTGGKEYPKLTVLP